MKSLRLICMLLLVFVFEGCGAAIVAGTAADVALTAAFPEVVLPVVGVYMGGLTLGMLMSEGGGSSTSSRSSKEQPTQSKIKNLNVNECGKDDKNCATQWNIRILKDKCDEDDYQACYDLYTTFVAEGLIFYNKSEFYKELLRKSCLKGGIKDACVAAQEMSSYEMSSQEGLDLPPFEFKEFFQITLKACDLGDERSCKVAGYCYRFGWYDEEYGQIVEKNKKLSNKYYQKYCDILGISPCSLIIK